MSAVQHSKPKASATQRATYFVYRTPLGRVTLGCDGQALTRVAFGVAEFEGEYRPCALTNKASHIYHSSSSSRKQFSEKGVGLCVFHSLWTN